MSHVFPPSNVECMEEKKYWMNLYINKNLSVLIVDYLFIRELAELQDCLPLVLPSVMN